MKREFLGDSYDAVKRLWQQILQDWAPLYAEPRFIPRDLRDEFTRITGIPLLPDVPTQPYSILNDPDTGIRLPAERNQGESRAHITLETICHQLDRPGLRAVITFDQSHYRHGSLKRKEQLLSKVCFLADKGRPSFYYVSHAPFLFAFSEAESQLSLQERLKSFGIPDFRFKLS